ncbi:hypothetical protein [Streptomyces sp. NPDC055099]
MPLHMRLRALAIVLGALTAVAMPTAAAFADTTAMLHPPAAPHPTPREEIQPAAHIVGEVARKGAERSTGRPVGMLPDQSPDTTCNRTILTKHHC